MSIISKAAKAGGVEEVICPHCESRLETKGIIKGFLQGILILLRDGQREVKLLNFGVFYAKMLKGRSHRTPVTPSGRLEYDDMRVFRFRSSANARKFLNETDEDEEDDDGVEAT